ncbi:nuclear transport factor 2 family protein [Nonomuraea sp. NPDC050663]|uniref:nuclear transport factor 2 family protein n=1 Tax=Nonomuraea sp. NPDC050663 TaxID=3364370 RepID=UPI0037B6CC02
MNARSVLITYLVAGAAFDRDAQIALLHDDAVLRLPYAPEGVPAAFAGKASVADFLYRLQVLVTASGYTFDRDQAHLVIHETADPEVVIAEIAAPGLENLQIFRVRDGLIVEIKEYFQPTSGAFVARALAA